MTSQNVDAVSEKRQKWSFYPLISFTEHLTKCNKGDVWQSFEKTDAETAKKERLHKKLDAKHNGRSLLTEKDRNEQW